MIRLFIALPLEEAIEQKLGGIISDLKSYGGKIKYVEPNNIHLTLKFLGDTELSQVDHIIQALEKIVPSFAPFKLELTSLGAFPNMRKPSVIWVGLKDIPEQLKELTKQVDRAMHALGWELEQRPFKPHLTLGRVKSPDNLERLIKMLPNYRIKPIPLQLDQLVLFQSTLTPQGPIYKKLQICELAERFSG